MPVLKKFVSYTLPFVLGGLLLYWVLEDLPLHELRAGLGNLAERLNLSWLVLAVAAYGGLALLHGVRFRWVLRQQAALSLPQAFSIYAIASLLNIFIPARAGDLYKSVHTTKLTHAPFAETLALATADLILWGFGFVVWMAVVAVIGWDLLATLPRLRLAIVLEAVGGLLGLGLFAALAPHFQRWVIPQSKWGGRLWLFVHGLYATLTPRVALRAEFLAVAGWLCEILIALSVVNGLGLHISFVQAALLMAAVTTAMIIPSPGGVGPFEAAGTYVLTLYGAPKAEAALLAIAYHLMFIAVPLVVGAACYLAQQLRERARPAMVSP